MYQLYYAPDNASLIVRMVLEELRAEYRSILVDRSSREQDAPVYRDLNPKGLIPVCVINDKPVFETAAIILSLAERHRELAPALNDPERPQFLKWLFFMSNSVHTDLRQLFYTDLYSGEAPDHRAIHRELALARLTDSVGILERHCAAQEGEFMMDEELTVLDFYLAMMLRWMQLFPRDAVCLTGLQDFPALRRLCESVQSLESVQRACTAEGISLPFFDSPQHAKPSEGSVI